MAKGGFFKNYRVYILTSVAYMGALLFGTSLVVPLSVFYQRAVQHPRCYFRRYLS